MAVFISFILLALLVGIAVGAVISYVVFLAWRRGRYRKIREPVCGRCGYIVRGVAELKCPECGEDLREVGIIAPGRRKRRRSPQNTRSPLQ